MFDLKNNTDAELVEVLNGIDDAIACSPSSNSQDEKIMKRLVAPFMIATVEEVIRLRRELAAEKELAAAHESQARRWKELYQQSVEK